MRRLLGLLFAIGCEAPVAHEFGAPCDPPAIAPLELAISPHAIDGPQQPIVDFIRDCVVVTADVGPPPSFRFDCGDAGEVALDVPGLAEAFPTTLAEGDAVEMFVASIYQASDSLTWLAARHEGNLEPDLIAIASWDPNVFFEPDQNLTAPLVLEFDVADKCDPIGPGSCNNGPKRRGVVSVHYEKGGALILDRNVDDVGDYRIWVGDAIRDEGECEGVNETWYEVLISRVAP